MELKLSGKLTREEGLYIVVGPFVRRRTVYFLKLAGVAIFALSAILFVQFGVTETALYRIILLSGFLCALLALRLLFIVVRIRHRAKDQEYETHLILTPEMVTMETDGRSQSIPVRQLSIQNDRRGVVARYDGNVFFFVPERALSSDARAKLSAMYGLAPPP